MKIQLILKSEEKEIVKEELEVKDSDDMSKKLSIGRFLNKFFGTSREEMYKILKLKE